MNDSGFEDGKRVPIVHAPADEESSPGPASIDYQLLCVIINGMIEGAPDAKEIGKRTLALGVALKVKSAPKSKSGLAIWLGISERHARRIWPQLIQCFEAVRDHLCPRPPIGKETENEK